MLSRLICKVILVVPRCKDCGEVDEEDEGQTFAELRVLGLMMPYFHAEKGSQTASKDSNGEEAGLLNTPFVVAGLPLVNAIEDKCHDVHQCKIKQNIFIHLLIYTFT